MSLPREWLRLWYAWGACFGLACWSIGDWSPVLTSACWDGLSRLLCWGWLPTGISCGAWWRRCRIRAWRFCWNVATHGWQIMSPRLYRWLATTVHQTRCGRSFPTGHVWQPPKRCRRSNLAGCSMRVRCVGLLLSRCFLWYRSPCLVVLPKAPRTSFCGDLPSRASPGLGR